MMAAVSLNYLQIGPRQGVHISPLRWRQTQFRPPEAGYQFRARVEPHPASTGFPARVVRRQFPSKPAAGGSSSLNSSRSNPSLTSPKKCPQLVNRQLSEGSQGGKEGLAFSLMAKAVVMKPRPSQRPSPAVTRAGSVLTSQQTFSYPDPTKIKGNVAFDLRLVELAKLESDTVKYEEFRSQMMSRTNRPSSPYERRPSSAKSARSMPRAAPQSSSRVGLAGSTDRDKRLGTAPLLNRKTSCPAMLSTSINGRSKFRPAPSYGTIRESRSATPVMQRVASRSHLSCSRSDEQASTRTWQGPQSRRDTESENCSQSESPRSPSMTPHITVTDGETPLQSESTEATQSISECCMTQSPGADPPPVLTYADCSSPYPQPPHAENANSQLEEVTLKDQCTAHDHAAICWKSTDGQPRSPKLIMTESRKLDESLCMNEGNLRVCSVTDLDGLPQSAEEGASSSDQKNVETNEKATQTSASKRKGSKTHSSKKLPLSAELRSDSSSRLDNLLDSSSDCSLRSTKSKKSRLHVSKKSHSTHASRRTK